MSPHLDSHHPVRAVTTVQEPHRLLDIARDNRDSCIQEIVFTETKLRETLLLVQFYSSQLDLARARLSQAEAWVGHVRAGMRKCGIPIDTQCSRIVAENHAISVRILFLLT